MSAELVEITSSLTVSVEVPLVFETSLNELTTPAELIELPLASQTRNLAGTVLPCLKTLILRGSALIGCRI